MKEEASERNWGSERRLGRRRMLVGLCLTGATITTSRTVGTAFGEPARTPKDKGIKVAQGHIVSVDRSSVGVEVSIDAQGDAVPPGRVVEARYRSTLIPPRAGDSVVLELDGGYVADLIFNSNEGVVDGINQHALVVGGETFVAEEFSTFRYFSESTAWTIPFEKAADDVTVGTSLGIVHMRSGGTGPATLVQAVRV